MSKATKHAYEVTSFDAKAENLEVGTILVDKNHVRKHHEPERVWDFASLETGEPTGYIAAKHLGEYEKVKDLLKDRS